MNSVWTNENNDESKNIKKFAIFMNNGSVITIDAYDYEWCDDVVEFSDTEDCVIATFKTNMLYAVSQCCFSIEEKQLMLPKYDETEEETE